MKEAIGIGYRQSVADYFPGQAASGGCWPNTHQAAVSYGRGSLSIQRNSASGLLGLNSLLVVNAGIVSCFLTTITPEAIIGVPCNGAAERWGDGGNRVVVRSTPLPAN